jgi:HlyD family secretion protein
MTSKAKRGLIIAGVVTAVVVVALVIRGFQSGSNNLTEIDIYSVSRSTMEERLSGTGSFVPELSITVYAKIAGSIDVILVNEGERVDAGDPLGGIDREDYIHSYRQAEISLESTRRNAYLSLMTKVSSYKSALLGYLHATRAEEKNRTLLAVDAISEDVLIRSSEVVATAELSYLSAREQLNLHLGNPLGGVPSVEDELDWKYVDSLPEVEQARLNLEAAARALENCELTAPIAGTITKIHPARGDRIGPNSPLFKVENLSSMKAEVLIDEVDIGKIVIGGQAEVTSDSILGDMISGAVASISPTVERIGNTRMSTVMISLDQGSRRLLAGASCTARIVAVSRSDALVIPLTAYRNEDGREYVFVVTNDDDEPGTALLEKREVTLGITTVNQVEVLSGLVAGETVALGDIYILRDGIRVRPSMVDVTE